MPQFNLPHLWPSDFQMEQFSQRHCSFWSSNAQLKSLGAQGNPAAVSAPLKNSKPKRWPSHESPKTAAMGLLGQQEQLQQIFGKTIEIELYIIKYVYIYMYSSSQPQGVPSTFNPHPNYLCSLKNVIKSTPANWRVKDPQYLRSMCTWWSVVSPLKRRVRKTQDIWYILMFFFQPWNSLWLWYV
jgi:hypothetical protein